MCSAIQSDGPSTGAVLATVPSKGSTNQSVFGFEEMVSTFLLSMFHARGAFCQVSGPGRPGMDGVFCAKASADARQMSKPEMPIIPIAREFMFSPRVTLRDEYCSGLCLRGDDLACPSCRA